MRCPSGSGFAHGFHGYLACALSSSAPCATKALAGQGTISINACMESCLIHTDSCVAFSVYLSHECWLYHSWDDDAVQQSDDNSVLCRRVARKQPASPPPLHVAPFSSAPPPPSSAPSVGSTLPPRPPLLPPWIPPSPSADNFTSSAITAATSEVSLSTDPAILALPTLDEATLVEMINGVSQLPLALRWAASLGVGLALLTIWAVCCVCALRGCPCNRSSTNSRGRHRHRYDAVGEGLGELDDGTLGDLIDELEDEMEQYREEAMLVRASSRPPQTLLVELNGAVCGTVPLATSSCRTVQALRKRAVEAASDLTGGLTIRALAVIEYLDEAVNLAIAITDGSQLPVALSVPTLKATFQSAAYRRGLQRGARAL